MYKKRIEFEMNDLFFLRNLLAFYIVYLTDVANSNFTRAWVSLFKKISNVIIGIKSGIPVPGVEVTAETPSGEDISNEEIQKLPKQELIKPRFFFRFKENLLENETELLRLLLEVSVEKPSEVSPPPLTPKHERIWLKTYLKKFKEVENLGEEERETVAEFKGENEKWFKERNQVVSDEKKFRQFFDRHYVHKEDNSLNITRERDEIFDPEKKFLRKLNREVPRSEAIYSELRGELYTVGKKLKKDLLKSKIKRG